MYENIVPNWAQARIEELNLQVYENGEYRQVYSFQGEIGEKKELILPMLTTTKLRLEITKLRRDRSIFGLGKTDPSLVEFAVYKVPSNTTENTLLQK